MNLLKSGKRRGKKTTLSFFANDSKASKKMPPAHSALDKSRSGVLHLEDGWSDAPLAQYIDFVDSLSPLDLDIDIDVNFDIGALVTTDIDAECLDSSHLNENSLYWVNASGQFNSPKPNHPSVVYLDKNLSYYHRAGLLHRTDGPAVSGDGVSEYWLYGVSVSEEEFKRYDENEKTIVFINEKGWIHRTDGPAFIKFYPNGQVIQRWFDNGTCELTVEKNRELINSESLEPKMSRTITPKKIATPKVKVKKMDIIPKIETTYLRADEKEAVIKMFEEHKPQLLKYRKEIQEAAKKIQIHRLGQEEFDRRVEEAKRALNKTKEEKSKPMTTDDRIIRSAPDLSGTRTEQFKEGFKFGLKKGAINNGSELFAKKMVSLTSQEGNEWMERFVQFVTLIGTAELLRRMPEGIAAKMRLDEETRMDASSLLRYISGENIGGDIVEIIAAVMPVIMEIVKDISADEINELAEQMENAQVEEEVEVSAGVSRTV